MAGDAQVMPPKKQRFKGTAKQDMRKRNIEFGLSSVIGSAGRGVEAEMGNVEPTFEPAAHGGDEWASVSRRCDKSQRNNIDAANTTIITTTSDSPSGSPRLRAARTALGDNASLSGTAATAANTIKNIKSRKHPISTLQTCDICCGPFDAGISFHSFQSNRVVTSARFIAGAADFQWKSNVTDTSSMISIDAVMCSRRGCLYDMTQRHRKGLEHKRARQDQISAAAPALLPRAAPKAKNDRICTTEAALRGLLHYFQPYGRILDMCGCTRDIIAQLLKGPEYNLSVMCNDINPRLPADSHIDASLVESAVPALLALNGGHKFDFVITSPPYSDEEAYLRCLDTMREITSVGFAVKLGASFMHPTRRRHAWLTENEPTSTIFLRKTKELCSPLAFGGEVWVIWLKQPRFLPDGRIVGQENLKAINFVT